MSVISKVILYSNGCPMCDGLKSILEQKKIRYELCSDLDEMARIGISHVPMLGVDGKLLSYKEALAAITDGGLPFEN